MATASCIKEQEKTGTWTQMFPNEQVTEQQSAIFVKKLLAVAVSNVTYLRAIFPEHAFGDRCLEDLNLKILRDDSTCPGSCQVIKWVKGCFDALEKKYLRMLILGIYVDSEDPETVIESYTFKFSYTETNKIDIYRNGHQISSEQTSAETKKATIRLLRTLIILTQSLQPLPDDVMMTMRLLYYEDVTPPDYEPPGFEPSNVENFRFEEEPMNIKVGDVITPFHTLRLRIKTDSKQFELGDGNEMTNAHVASSQDDLSMGTDIDTMAPQVDKGQSVVQECEQGDAPLLRQPKEVDMPKNVARTPGSDGQAVQETNSTKAFSETDEVEVKCSCGCNVDDGLMILCAVCQTWQHGACYFILKEEEAPQKHVCEFCSSGDDALSMSSGDLNKARIEKEAQCLWRRTLVACTELHKVMAPSLAKRLGVEASVATGLMSRLEREGYIKNPSKGKRMGKIVNKQKITAAGYEQYFKITEDEDDKIEQLSSLTKEIHIVDQKCNDNTDSVAKTGRENDSSIQTKSSLKSDKSRGRKRARIPNASNQDFEISNSQEVEKPVNSRKRRKASVVSKALCV